MFVVCVCVCEWKREEVCYVRENEREGTEERSVLCACVTFPTAVFSQLWLLEVGVTLNLIHSRYNLGSLQQSLSLSDGEV